MSNNLLVVRQ